MRAFRVTNYLAAAVIVASLGLATTASAAEAETRTAEATMAQRIEAGRKVLEDRKKGNCLSCHLIVDAELPGNAGPPLIAMKTRWPDREALKSQIYDPSLRNPDTIMPPYGRHRMLTAEELDVLVDFVQSL